MCMENVQPFEGSTVQLFCNIIKVGQPDFIKGFRWLRDGVELSNLERLEGLWTANLSIKVAVYVFLLI